jgi:3-oxoacyl-[acyl-carrier protein] reductase
MPTGWRRCSSAPTEFGGLDVVVHAAGKMALAPLAELDLDVLDDLLRTNVRGTFVVGREAVRRIRDGGSIVNFSTSVVGLASLLIRPIQPAKGRSRR